jgi:PPM family protein phosphatase
VSSDLTSTNATTAVSFRIGAMTDTGRVRAVNQDALLVTQSLAAVADGMGGHAAGEVASALTLKTLRERTIAATDDLTDAIDDANRAVFHQAITHPQFRGMGTTLCLLTKFEAANGSTQLVIANVGDSRAYHWADGVLRRLTRDHSYVADLVALGQLSESAARVHPKRNILTRAVGVDVDVDVDLLEVPIRVGDRYLLCSDGLVNEVGDDLIAGTLDEVRDPQEAAEILVHLANSGGGRDNITVLVIDLVADGASTRSAPRFLGGGVDVIDQLEITLDGLDPAMTDLDDALTRRFDSSIAATAVSATPPPPSYDLDGDATGGWLDEVDVAQSFDEARSFDDDHDPEPSRAPRQLGDDIDLPPGGSIHLPPVNSVRPRRLTFRVLLFLCLISAVAYGVKWTVEYGARSGYTVRSVGNDIVLYEGRADPFLWVDPIELKRYDTKLNELSTVQQRRVQDGEHFAAQDEADLAVKQWRDNAARDEQATQSTLVPVSTIPRSTTAAPTTAPAAPIVCLDPTIVCPPP